MILLTGATGFLGSNLLHHLLKQGEEVVVIKRSFSNVRRIATVINRCKMYDIDQSDLSLVFKENDIQTIIHTAANYGRNGETILEIAASNLYFPLELLSLAIHHKVKTFVNTDTSLPKDMNPYSLSKNQFTDWLKLQSEQLCVMNVELQYFYGPGDDEWKLIPMILRKLINKEPYINFTSGNQQRDFIFIDDVMAAFIVLIKQLPTNGFHHYALGSGDNYTIKQVAALCKQVIGNEVTALNFGVLPERKNELLHSQADLRGLMGLGWTPQTSIIEGLHITAKGIIIPAVS